jgi:pyridoxamine 5'-phosphate oxidase
MRATIRTRPGAYLQLAWNPPALAIRTVRIMHSTAFLPDVLPADPFALFADWFAEAVARRAQPNPDAMVVATVDADGGPSARVVLCKHLVASPGYVVFFTNYQSRKGQALSTTPRAAAVFHWDGLSRQARIEGPIVRSPAAESDAYFASRPVASRLGAWASRQSEPLISREALADQVAMAAKRFGVEPAASAGDVPRPPHWGGFRLWPDAMELWVEGPGRVHDRARWTRALRPTDEFGYACGPWSGTRLNP